MNQSIVKHWRTAGTLLLILLLLTPLGVQAQDEETEYRMEWGVGVGTSFGLTDVNSKFFGGSHVAGELLARFPLNPRMAIKAQLGVGGLRGNTVNVDNFYPADPNVSGPTMLQYAYKGAIIDLSALYELHFLPYGFQQDFREFKRISPYIQMGLGLTYGTPSNAFTFNIPLGAGVKFKVSRRVNLGLEWRMHFTPSDKLDGLKAPLGIKSGGFRNKDYYSFTQLTTTYDLAPRCPTCNRDER
jgi:hypothetical protein